MWIDIGRRDIVLADGWDTVGPRYPGQAPAGPCAMPGCGRPGEHDGMCGRHFWRATAHEDATPRQLAGSIQTPWMRHRAGELAEAYLAAVDLVQRVPLGRWVLVHCELDRSRDVLRRVRTLLSRAAGRPGLELDTERQYRLLVTDRQAAVDALEETALSTHYWRQAVAELELQRGDA